MIDKPKEPVPREPSPGRPILASEEGRVRRVVQKLAEGSIVSRQVRGGSPAAGAVPVLLERDGGADGTGSTPATWAYRLFSITDTGRANALVEGLTPVGRLTANGSYTQAEDGSAGLAFQDAAGDWVLVQAFGEKLNTVECSCGGG